MKIEQEREIVIPPEAAAAAAAAVAAIAAVAANTCLPVKALAVFFVVNAVPSLPQPCDSVQDVVVKRTRCCRIGHFPVRRTDETHGFSAYQDYRAYHRRSALLHSSVGSRDLIRWSCSLLTERVDLFSGTSGSLGERGYSADRRLRSRILSSFT